MKITECTFNGPDNDGDMNYTGEATIENVTEHTIELIKTSSIILDERNIGFAGSHDNEHDVFIEPGDSDKVDVGTYGKGIENLIKDKTKLSVNATLFRREFSKLGTFEVQNDHKTIVTLDKTLELSSGNIKVYGSCLRRDKPDDEGCVSLTSCLGVRNTSDSYIERFLVKMVLIDQEDAILDETSDYTSIPPNMGHFMEPSIWNVKKGRLKNCQVRLGVSVFSPIGALTAEMVAKEE